MLVMWIHRKHIAGCQEKRCGTVQESQELQMCVQNWYEGSVTVVKCAVGVTDGFKEEVEFKPRTRARRDEGVQMRGRAV